MAGINDTPAAFDAMAKRAKVANASFLAANPLFLKPCSKGTFLAFVHEHFPALEASYEKRYADEAFVSKAYQKRIADLLAAVLKKYDLGRRHGDIQPVFATRIRWIRALHNSRSGRSRQDSAGGAGRDPKAKVQRVMMTS